LLAHAIPAHLRDEQFKIKHYTNRARAYFALFTYIHLAYTFAAFATDIIVACKFWHDSNI